MFFCLWSFLSNRCSASARISLAEQPAGPAAPARRLLGTLLQHSSRIPAAHIKRTPECAVAVSKHRLCCCLLFDATEYCADSCFKDHYLSQRHHLVLSRLRVMGNGSNASYWLCSFVCLQMDLEPEGKVYICISLTGSFIDGKAARMSVHVHAR